MTNKKTSYIFFIRKPSLTKMIIYAKNKIEAIKIFNNKNLIDKNNNRICYYHVSKIDNINNLLGNSYKLINYKKATINQ
mgnify:FL=1